MAQPQLTKVCTTLKSKWQPVKARQPDKFDQEFC